jgi:hypothetical protein
MAAILLASCGSVGAPVPAPIANTPTVAPAAATPAANVNNDLFCGELSPNTITSGQGSGPNTFELRPTTSLRTGTVGSVRFGGWMTPDRPALGTYVCAWLVRGAPIFGFQSRVLAGYPGYIAEILPNAFALPQSCTYVGRPSSDADGVAVLWKVDCGTVRNRSIRGTLAPAFTQQGWVSCASGLATEVWRKDTSRLTVLEGSGAAGEYPSLTQRLYLTGGGGPPNAGCP